MGAGLAAERNAEPREFRAPRSAGSRARRRAVLGAQSLSLLRSCAARMDVARNLRADDSARRRHALGRAGARNYTNLIVRRGRMEGFLVTDYAARFGEAIAELARWSAEGKVRDRVDVVDGLENAPKAFRRLFTGDNLGQQLVG